MKTLATMMALTLLLAATAACLTGCNETKYAVSSAPATAQMDVAPSAAGSSAGVVAVAQTAPSAAPASEPAVPVAPAAVILPAQPKPVVDLIPPQPNASPFRSEDNFVTTWAVLGPFKYEAPTGESEQYQAMADKEFVKDEGSLNGTQQAPEGAAWKIETFKGAVQVGQIDLQTLYPDLDYAAAYAVVWINSPVAMRDAQILVGSDDYIKIWVNGTPVYTYNRERRGSDYDQDTVKDVELKQGLNLVVVKVVDVVSEWNFYFRMADAKGLPTTMKLQPLPVGATGTAPAAAPSKAPADGAPASAPAERPGKVPAGAAPASAPAERPGKTPVGGEPASAPAEQPGKTPADGAPAAAPTKAPADGAPASAEPHSKVPAGGEPASAPAEPHSKVPAGGEPTSAPAEPHSKAG